VVLAAKKAPEADGVCWRAKALTATAAAAAAAVEDRSLEGE